MRWKVIGASGFAVEHMIGALRSAGQDPAAVVRTSARRAAEFASADATPVGTASRVPALENPVIRAVCRSSAIAKRVPEVTAAIAAGRPVPGHKPLAMPATDASRTAQAAGKALDGAEDQAA